MSDAPKFKTFRDLKSIPKIDEKLPANLAGVTGIVAADKLHNDVSPIRDFQKVPNSIPRNLNLFRGKSKQVWDYLWSVSRGAINPSRTIRKSRKEIKDHTKIGSMVTVDAAIEHLRKVGLLEIIPNIGSVGGNEYEIFTPEEIAQLSTSISSISSYTNLTQKLDILDILETSISSITQTVDNKTIYGDPKTSLKTNTKNDDDSACAREGFSLMIERLDAAAKKLTGKAVGKREAEAWGTLADLLILELEVAASRTNGISSVPAFLTELLRRQFFVSRQLSPNKSGKSKIDTVGKPDSGTYEIKELDQKGRESALEQLREFAEDDFLNDFKKWYTEKDWQWIMKQLEIS